MREFLQANIPWIFSGVGIPIIAGLWWLLRRRFSQPTVHASAATAASALPEAPRQVASSIRELESAAAPDTLSPQHMMKTVAAAAPLARDHVKQQFVGLPVEWRLPFGDARMLPQSPVATVYFSLPDSNYEVRCEASVDEYPFLRAAVPGEMFGIRGVVADVGSFEVTLRDTVLTR